jgi:hypothetical protein
LFFDFLKKSMSRHILACTWFFFFSHSGRLHKGSGMRILYNKGIFILQLVLYWNCLVCDYGEFQLVGRCMGTFVSIRANKVASCRHLTWNGIFTAGEYRGQEVACCIYEMSWKSIILADNGKLASLSPSRCYLAAYSPLVSRCSSIPTGRSRLRQMLPNQEPQQECSE